MAAVRTTRARIIHLRNDYKDLMTAIEKHLHEHFASLQDTDDVPTSLPSRGAGMLGDSIPDTLDEAFAKVNTVVAGSPADSAGLQPGDEIRNFGYVNKSNHDGLKKVAECVQGNQGVSYFPPGETQYLELPPPPFDTHTLERDRTDRQHSKTFSSRYHDARRRAGDKNCN